MKKVELIKDRCIGCGACMSIAPDNFTFDDEGRAKLINENITNDAIEASETCPVSAIIIENSEHNCSCNEDCNCEGDCNCNENNKCSENCNCHEDCNCNEDNKCSEICNCHE